MQCSNRAAWAPMSRYSTAIPNGLGAHDGFRILAECDGNVVTLHSRNGYDFAERFPLAAALRVRSCLIHGEAIVAMRTG
jgi:hypothetical protein